MKMVLNNRSLTNLYPDIPKTPLTLNHLFHAVCETILALMSNPSLIKSLVKLVGSEIQKLIHLLEHFLDRWRRI